MHRPLLALVISGMVLCYSYAIMNPVKMCCGDCHVEMRLEERCAFSSCANFSVYYLRMGDHVQLAEPVFGINKDYRTASRCRFLCDRPSSFSPNNSCVPGESANGVFLVAFLLGFPLMIHALQDYPE